MTKKILIMGATGKVGQEVVKCLCAQKIKVNAVVHQPKNAALLTDCGWTEDGIEKFILIVKGIQRGDFSAIFTDLADILGRPPILFEQYAYDQREFWQ